MDLEAEVALQARGEEALAVDVVEADDVVARRGGAVDLLVEGPVGLRLAARVEGRNFFDVGLDCGFDFGEEVFRDFDHFGSPEFSPTRVRRRV